MLEDIFMFMFVFLGGFLMGMRFAEQRVIKALSKDSKEDEYFDRLP